jgi:hypothetical protein
MKDTIKFFTQSKAVKGILGETITLSAEQQKQIQEFFVEFPDGDRSSIWRKNIALWICHGLNDWIQRRYQLQQCTSNSQTWHKLMYGSKWLRYYQLHQAQIKNRLPSRLDYWVGKGFTPDQALEKVVESQKNKAQKAAQKLRGSSEYTVRSTKYWIACGYSLEQAQDAVAAIQRRDRDFYIYRYGPEQGNSRYLNSVQKRKQTWQTKDRIGHSFKTIPRSFNPDGQEMQAITRFIKANHIDIRCCMYGAPKDQFFQHIPGVGYRRYDLAVFDNPSHSKLLYILEYHGPGHINFSDYKPELANEPITIDGKRLAHLGTYGAAYENDKIKRDHILSCFPGVRYLVMWTDDFYNQRYLIDELSS